VKSHPSTTRTTPNRIQHIGASQELKWRMLKKFEDVTNIFLPYTENIADFGAMLSELNKSRISAAEFEGMCFKNYSFLVSKFLETLKNTPEESLQVSELLPVLLSISEVYARLGRLESSKLITLKNHLIRHLVPKSIALQLSNLSTISLLPQTSKNEILIFVNN